MRLKMTFPQALALIAAAGFTASAAAASAPVSAKGPQSLVAHATQGTASGKLLDCKKHPKDPRCKK